MYTLLTVALLLALLFDIAAATSPAMDPTMPAIPASIQPFYPDPEGILTVICDLCGIPMGFCMCAPSYQVQHAPTFTAETFYGHPEWPQNDTFAVCDPMPESAPLPVYHLTEQDRRLLLDANVRQLDENATTIQPSTVQMHVEDTYTPGDRLVTSAPRRPPHKKRQALRLRGFPCPYEGCERTFDRSCDLNRHQKTHLDRSERPHKCTLCDVSFLYPKDRDRHQRTHEQSGQFRCPVPSCTNVFSRRDNLLRHQRKQHAHMSP